MIWIVVIISFIASGIIVNKGQKLFMKLLNMDVMFFNPKTKLIIIIVFGLVLAAALCTMFGIEIPRK